MVTDHEMRMEALRLFEENEKLRAAVVALTDALWGIRTYSDDRMAVNIAANVLDAIPGAGAEQTLGGVHHRDTPASRDASLCRMKAKAALALAGETR